MIQSPHETRCCPSSVPIESVPSQVPSSVGYSEPGASRSSIHASCIQFGQSALVARRSSVIWNASITTGFLRNFMFIWFSKNRASWVGGITRQSTRTPAGDKAAVSRRLFLRWASFVPSYQRRLFASASGFRLAPPSPGLPWSSRKLQKFVITPRRPSWRLTNISGYACR